MSRWFGKRWRDRQWRQTRREFVYLDETSVTSLMAARHGSIAETVTDSLSRTSESEVTSSVSLPVQSAKIGLGSRLKAAETSSQQVVRRTVVQGTFRDLRAGDSDLAVTTQGRAPRRPLQKYDTLSQMAKALPKLVKEKHAFRVDDLRRGDVLELEVTLEASKIYKIVTTISSLLEIIGNREKLFGIDELQMEEIKPIVDVLENMLVGLVPIVGVATKYKILAINGFEYIVDERSLAPRSEVERKARPLALVGVTELPSYWKDLRRVLFDKQMYTAYVRIAKSGLNDNWSEVKLADVLETMAPGISDEFRRIPELFDSADTGKEDIESARFAKIVSSGFDNFGRQLSILLRAHLREDGLRSAVAQAVLQISSESDLHDLSKTRQAFELIVTAVQGDPPMASALNTTEALPSLDSPIREIVRTLREATIIRMHDALADDRGRIPTADPSASSKGQFVQAQLEVEFVAIYW